MSENDIFRIVLFGNKNSTKDVKIGIIASSIRFIKDSKRFDESISSWDKHYLLETNYLLWRAVRFSFSVYIVLYITLCN